MAYNAARTLATIAIRAAGYRVRQTGGAHYNTFLAMETALGSSASTLATYFDNCRVKRNELIYDAANRVGENDAGELLKNAKKLRVLVEDWIARNRPDLV